MKVKSRFTLDDAHTDRRDRALQRVDPGLEEALATCPLHGIRERVVRGTAVSEQALKYAAEVEKVAELGWQQAQRDAGAPRQGTRRG